MISFAKPVPTEDLYIVQKEEFSMTSYIYEKCALDERPSIFIRGNPIFSPERMLHKDYDCKGSVEKKTLVVIHNGPVANRKTALTLTLVQRHIQVRDLLNASQFGFPA
jgi:hypothetical protein